jgi:hypothetical protein
LLEPEPHGGGMQVTLRPRGVARWFQAAFLFAWLGGWAMGEWFALGLFASALEAVFGPGALPEGLRFGAGPGVSRGEAAMVFAFVVPWLALWTLGGGLALAQALLALVGREIVRWSPDGLEIERHALVRISGARVEPTKIHGFHMRRGALVARLAGRSVAVARLGTDLERSELATRLDAWHRGFGGRAGLGPGDAPCPGWTVARDETGAWTLTPARGNRFLVAAMLAFVASGLYAMTGSSMLGGNVRRVVIALLSLGLVATVLAAAAVWLVAVRESWHPRPGSLEIRRRAFGRRWSRTLSPLALELRAHSDTDGDLHWTLTAVAPGRRRQLATALHDSSVPESLALWLSARTGVSVEYTGRAREERRAA